MSIWSRITNWVTGSKTNIADTSEEKPVEMINPLIGKDHETKPDLDQVNKSRTDTHEVQVS